MKFELTSLDEELGYHSESYGAVSKPYLMIRVKAASAKREVATKGDTKDLKQQYWNHRPHQTVRKSTLMSRHSTNSFSEIKDAREVINVLHLVKIKTTCKKAYDLRRRKYFACGTRGHIAKDCFLQHQHALTL